MSTTLTAPPQTAPLAQTARPSYAPIRFSRILAVELRKMFDTRSGFWLMSGIVGLALLATAAVIAFAPDDELTYDSFGAAVGIPMVIILPVIAILSVTGEWSQRSGLSTFTLVPHRGRVIAAKGLLSVAVGVVGMAVAFAVGAVGNVLGSAIAGVETVWDVSWTALVMLVLANVLGLMVGFTLGVLMRNSAGAIVAYFVYNFVLTGLTELLAASQQWFRDIRGWVDFNFAQGPLFDSDGAFPTATEWAHLGVTGLFWLVIPLAVGLIMVMRSEVK
jgi:ABC-2 type transport system permease protein